MSQEGYWVYVLRNPTGMFYIGISNNPAKRLRQHNAGHSPFTRKHRPRELLWQEGPLTLSDARKLENWPKRQKGGVGFRSFTGL